MKCTEILKKLCNTYEDETNDLLVGKKRSRSSLTNTLEDELEEVEAKE